MNGIVTSKQKQCKTVLYSNNYAESLLKTNGKKNCSSLARSVNRSHDQLQRYLVNISENQQEIKSVLLSIVIEQNKKTPGYIIGDNTVLLKEYAKEMEGVSRQHSGNKIVPGIGLMAAVWTNFTDTYSLDLFAWKKGDPSKIKTATDMLISLTQQTGAKGVINDAAFASLEAINSYNQASVYFAMRFHANRVITVPGYESVGRMPIKDHPAFKMQGNNRQIIKKIIWHNTELHVVSVKLKHKTKGWVQLFLVTNMGKKAAKEITQIYKGRWKIEVFFRTCKQNYGLGDCQSRSLKVQEAHCLAVFFAYNLVKLDPDSRLNKKSKTKNSTLMDRSKKNE